MALVCSFHMVPLSFLGDTLVWSSMLTICGHSHPPFCTVGTVSRCFSSAQLMEILLQTACNYVSDGISNVIVTVREKTFSCFYLTTPPFTKPGTWKHGFPSLVEELEGPNLNLIQKPLGWTGQELPANIRDPRWRSYCSFICVKCSEIHIHVVSVQTLY